MKTNLKNSDVTAQTMAFDLINDTQSSPAIIAHKFAKLAHTLDCQNELVMFRAISYQLMVRALLSEKHLDEVKTLITQSRPMIKQQMSIIFAWYLYHLAYEVPSLLKQKELMSSLPDIDMQQFEPLTQWGYHNLTTLNHKEDSPNDQLFFSMARAPIFTNGDAVVIVEERQPLFETWDQMRLIRYLSRRFMTPKPCYIFMSQLNNGEILMTTNSLKTLTFGPKFNIEVEPSAIPLKNLANKHQQRLARVNKKGFGLTPLNTVTELQQFRKVVVLERNAYRQSIDGITDQELVSIFGRNNRYYKGQIHHWLRLIKDLYGNA